MSKAISPLLAIGIIVAFTISIAVVITGFSTSMIKSQTTAAEQYKGCTGASIDVSMVKCFQSGFDYSGDNSLVGYWKFNGEAGENLTFFRDWSSYGNNGTCSGSSCPAATGGKVGNALQFDGSDDYVDAGNGASLNITNAITVEAWVKQNDNGVNTIVSKSSWWGPYFLYLNANQAFFTIGTSSSDRLEISTSVISQPYAWHHIVGVAKSGTSIEIFVDGILTASSYTSVPSIGSSSAYSLSVGRETEENAFHFNGTIDEVRIYNRSLSAQEILDRYNHHRLSMVVSNPSNVNLTGINMLNVMDKKQYVNNTNASIGTGEVRLIETNTSRGDVSLLRVSASNCPVYSQLTNETFLVARCD